MSIASIRLFTGRLKYVDENSHLLQSDQEKREICEKFRKLSKWQICMQILSIYDSLKTRKDYLSVRFTVTVKIRKIS